MPDSQDMDMTAPASGRPDSPVALPTTSVHHDPEGDVVAPRAPSVRPRARSSSFDPGWLFVIAGVLVLGATVLIPAADDLDEAQFLRDRARLIQQHRELRIARYREYLNALSSKDRQLVVALASSQLNEIPSDRRVLEAWPEARIGDASVFPALEPPPLTLPARHKVESTLMKLATQDRSRLWMIAGGAALVLFGLLPRATRRA